MGFSINTAKENFIGCSCHCVFAAFIFEAILVAVLAGQEQEEAIKEKLYIVENTINNSSHNQQITILTTKRVTMGTIIDASDPVDFNQTLADLNLAEKFPDITLRAVAATATNSPESVILAACELSSVQLYCFNSVIQDISGQCLFYIYTTVYLVYILVKRKADVFISSTRADETMVTLSMVSSVMRIPFMGFGSGLTILSEKELHPMYLRLDPPLSSSSKAVVGILERNGWHSFAYFGGRDEDSSAFLQELQHLTNSDNWTMYMAVSSPEDMGNVTASLKTIRQRNLRVIVLQCSVFLAKMIFQAAEFLEMTREGYAWIVTPSLLTSDQEDLAYYPVGLIGIENRNENQMKERFKDAAHIVASAAQELVSRGLESVIGVSRQYFCQNETSDPIEPIQRYNVSHSGNTLLRYLSNVKITEKDRTLSFNENGDLNPREFVIKNLKLDGLGKKTWEKVGYWKYPNHVHINSIMWPGHTEVIPDPDKQKRRYRVVTLREQPFIFVRDIEKTGECFNAGYCLEINGSNPEIIERSFVHFRENKHKQRHNDTEKDYKISCCSGMAYSILNRLSTDMNFEYDLYLVKDGKYGIPTNDGEWSGMVQDLISGSAEMAIGSFSINSERSKRIDFSAAFFYTNLGIMVAKREGDAQLGAFLEPMHFSMWLGIFVTLHLTAFFATIYEWNSPYGLTPYGRRREKVFSFPSALNLCWSLLFSHTVSAKSPKCWASRFLVNLWAAFSLIFIASYTANLAAFMVGEKSPNDISGINDPRLQKPGFRFATVKASSTESFLKGIYPEMASYMAKFNVKNSEEGVKRLKNNELDAFIWDQAVLDYKVSSDSKCELKQVGKPFASEGYGIGLAKGIGLQEEVSLKIYKFWSAGILEELSKRWYDNGGCNKENSDTAKEINLDLNHVTGVFILLIVGAIFAGLTLIVEWMVNIWVLPRLKKKKNQTNCLPFTQRLHRAIHWKETKETTMADTFRLRTRLVGTRLCEHRTRDSVGALMPPPPNETSQSRQKETLPRPVWNIPMIRNSTAAGKKSSMSECDLKQVNMSVQTDDTVANHEVVNNKLREVDASIAQRIQVFEADLKKMRQELARALMEKEQLFRRLCKLESEYKTQGVQELSTLNGDDREDRARTTALYPKIYRV